MIALKRYGQNFLVDKNILGLMVKRSGACESDCVLEIGPGHGVLTRALLDAGVKCLHTVELDERFRPELEDMAASDARLMLHWGDAVKFDYAALSPFPNKIIANIPYNITTPLIWKLLEHSHMGMKYQLYMLQKEAADRLTAKPDTKARYPLGVTVEAMGHAAVVRKVPRECFRPVPKVESAIVEIVIEHRTELAGSALWRELLHRAFAHRRKTLAGNLKGFCGVEMLEGLGGMRAEDLTCDEWLKIYETVKAHNLDAKSQVG